MIKYYFEALDILSISLLKMLIIFDNLRYFLDVLKYIIVE